ncbi:cbb3-type cytochrome c oxidase subunit I [Methylomagnum sp.]
MATTTDLHRAPILVRASHDSPLAEELKREWETKPGWLGNGGPQKAGRALSRHRFRLPDSRRRGGHPPLWQHLFWMFGHPWVYAIVPPAMSIVSEALPVFCRRPLVGYSVVAPSTVLTMVIGFGVWVHHMFATGLPFLSMSFFGGASNVQRDHHSQRGGRIRLDRHHLAGPIGVHHGLFILRGLHPAVRHWRRVWLHDGGDALRLAIDRYLFRGGPHLSLSRVTPCPL